jgi:hypothetical protein
MVSAEANAPSTSSRPSRSAGATGRTAARRAGSLTRLERPRGVATARDRAVEPEVGDRAAEVARSALPAVQGWALRVEAGRAPAAVRVALRAGSPELRLDRRAPRSCATCTSAYPVRAAGKRRVSAGTEARVRPTALVEHGLGAEWNPSTSYERSPRRPAFGRLPSRRPILRRNRGLRNFGTRDRDCTGHDLGAAPPALRDRRRLGRVPAQRPKDECKPLRWIALVVSPTRGIRHRQARSTFRVRCDTTRRG